ncbi:hypothetical protein [Pantoea agglomerans]|uniref:hypothetical protein n=1 Tax=Enterobacter agglomerans TaxID=549 RepID=UPI0011B0D72B|nr:hypothetical protein [Pantoea agglomerans]UBN52307.1 hypothetical protein LB453_01725 [Pantoea agglomerans]
MRNFRLPLLIALVLLSGCQATPQEARMKSADFHQASGRSASELSECIYRGWSSTEVVQKDNSTHLEHENQRVTVYTWENSMFADVYKRGAGSEVRFYKTFSMGPEVLADRSRIVKRCA